MHGRNLYVETCKTFGSKKPYSYSHEWLHVMLKYHIPKYELKLPLDYN